MLTISDYAEEAVGAIMSWLDLHSNPDSWSEYFYGFLGSYLNKKELDHLFPYSNWEKHVTKHILGDYSLMVCEKCSEYHLDEYYCRECDEELEIVADEEALKSDYWGSFFDDGLEKENYYFQKALRNEIFQDWKNQFNLLDFLIGEAREALDGLRNSESGGDFLAALLMLNHVCHAGGYILEDYSNLHTWIDDVSNGLDNVFDGEDIQYFIEKEWEYVRDNI